MIGKITIGKSFGGCIKYCLNDKVQKENEAQVMKERAEVILYNQCFGNERELITQFNDVRKLNPSLSKPVLHITLSLTPGKQLANHKLVEMCQDCSKEMGFESNQYIAILHKDTGHQHLHIVANRIGFDKRTVKDNNNYQKIAGYCREMELKYELKQVQNPRLFQSQRERLVPRQNLRNEQLKREIQQTLKIVSNYGQFEQKMKLLGYDIIKGRGIAFVDKKNVKIKGSEVDFSLMKIEKILDMKQELAKRIILEKPRERESLNQRRLRTQKLILSRDHTGYNDQKQILNTALEKHITELTKQLMQPEHLSEGMPAELFKKLQKKKRQRHHH